MEILKLVIPDNNYRNEYLDFIDECKDDISKCGMGYYMPFSEDSNFESEINRLINNSRGLDLPEGWVPASTYWMINESVNRIIGVITIRHSLIGYLFFRGGHISYYIRPSERCKGFATKMLNLGLGICKELKLREVMITCAKNNIGSAKVIKTNGGIFHSEDIEGEELFERYWIIINHL